MNMKSIIDQVISERTAELISHEDYTYPVEYYWVKGQLVAGELFESIPLDALKAPSLEMLKKFLREKRGIVITPLPITKTKWMAEVMITENSKVIVTGEIVYGNSYEEALEKQIMNLYEQN